MRKVSSRRKYLHVQITSRGRFGEAEVVEIFEVIKDGVGGGARGPDGKTRPSMVSLAPPRPSTSRSVDNDDR